MSFLAPLYLAGLLALSLPVLFHLIRRMPRGQLPFSSLMFLSASPPRLTRKSRLNNLLLLFLRLSILTLLALAFARPFLREAAHLELLGPGSRRIAIVVDTSASMRRGDLWEQAVRIVHRMVDGLGPADQVALYGFSDEVETLVDFDDEMALQPARRVALVKSRLGSVVPGWGATDLGSALATVADGLEIDRDTAQAGASLKIVLVTDLQRGSHLEALDGYEWPANVHVQVERVALSRATNAGMEVLEGGQDASSESHTRVRVSSESDASNEHYSLHWASAKTGEVVAAAVNVHVPPGESRVVEALAPEDNSEVDRLILKGDDHEFDNTLYVLPRDRQEVTVIYIGDEETGDSTGLRYYLERALTTNARQEVRFVSESPNERLTKEVPSARLVVVTSAVGDALQRQLQETMERGGTVLLVLKDAISAVKPLGGLLGEEGDYLAIEEATVDDYVMLSEIDFSDPLFAPFRDPRFSDFAKIHFWKYRRLEVNEKGDVGVLARFDNGDPAILQRQHGRGRLIVFVSGWNPEDSQLALSSKFVPLLMGLLDETKGGMGGSTLPRASYWVHDRVQWDNQDGDRTVLKPDGSRVKLAEVERAFDGTTEPGIYRTESGRGQGSFAVNIVASESKTAPLDLVELSQRGVRMQGQAPNMERQRQLRDLELESSQKLWRWLLLLALFLVILETWISGLSALRRTDPQVST